MDTEKIKEKVNIAKEAVQDLEEPLKSKAFEIVLAKLLSQPTSQAGFKGSLSSREATSGAPESGPIVDATDDLMNVIDSTAHPVMYNLSKVLDRALYVLFIAKNEQSIDGLTPAQISKILTIKFRIATTNQAVSMALMKAGNLVDRRRINATGGLAFEYRIMHPGEDYINNIISNPPTETHIPNAKKFKAKTKGSSPAVGGKKPKVGLKARVSGLFDEGFFAKPKEADEVKKELETKGFTYNYTPICTALLRLVKKGRLRRVKELKGNKEIYKYCNP